MNDPLCANCNAACPGRYCPACGQKTPSDEDRRLGPLLLGIFTELTSVDGRFWRTLVALMFKPGWLTREYFDGRRARYMAPVTLFLIANALYFLSPGLSDFDLTLVEQTAQAHSRWTRSLLDAKLAAKGLSLQAYAPVYAVASGNVGKLLLIVHVPFIALALALFASKTRRYFADHVVAALHLFTFLMFYIQLSKLALVLTTGFDFALLDIVLSALPILFWMQACRRAYRSSIPRALNAGAAAIGLLVACNLLVYRTMQFLIALAIS